jgi:hypothetical protein
LRNKTIINEVKRKIFFKTISVNPKNARAQYRRWI